MKIMNKIFFCLLFILGGELYAKQPISKSRLDQLSGVKSTNVDDKSKWDQRYSNQNFVYGKLPSKFLAENYSYIKSGSTVLDMGMGEGRNAVFLAQKGYKVTGVDISSIAVRKANLLAKEYDVRLRTITASFESYNMPDESVDAIICFYYVDRDLISKMIKWLRPGGVIFYEAYTTDQKKLDKKYAKEADSSFVQKQELLSLFRGMEVLKFEEPLHEKEFRSSIIVRKE